MNAAANLTHLEQQYGTGFMPDETRSVGQRIQGLSPNVVIPAICAAHARDPAAGEAPDPPLFLVDCRPEPVAAAQGRFADAVALSPARLRKLREPGERRRLEDTFGPLRSAVHVVIMVRNEMLVESLAGCCCPGLTTDLPRSFPSLYGTLGRGTGLPSRTVRPSVPDGKGKRRHRSHPQLCQLLPARRLPVRVRALRWLRKSRRFCSVKARLPPAEQSCRDPAGFVVASHLYRVFRPCQAAAHAYLARKGSPMSLSPQDVLVDYDSAVSLFAQLEAARREEYRHKTKRKKSTLQKIIDGSMARLAQEDERRSAIDDELSRHEAVVKMKQTLGSFLVNTTSMPSDFEGSKYNTTTKGYGAKLPHKNETPDERGRRRAENPDPTPPANSSDYLSDGANGSLS